MCGLQVLLIIDIHVFDIAHFCSNHRSVTRQVHRQSLLTSAVEMLSAVRGAVAYIESSKKVGTSGHQLDSVVANRLANLKAMVATSSPALDDMTDAIEVIGESTCFSQEQKTYLLMTFHTQMEDGGCDVLEGVGSGKSQSHLFVENYLTEALYKILKDKSIIVEVRIESFDDFLQLQNGCKF